MLLKVAPVSSDALKRYSWSLKPFLTWLNVIGINLPINQISWPFRLAFIVYAALWLSVNIATNFYTLKIALKSENQTSRELATVAYSWTMAISYCNMTFSDVGSHLGFLFIIGRKWKALWTAIERMEAEFHCRNELYRKCRYITLAALFYILSHGTAYHTIIIYDMVTSYWSANMLDNIGYIVVTFMDYFSISGWALFCLLGWFLPLHLQMIVGDIDQFQLPPNTEPAKIIDERLRVWKRQFGLISECLHLLNETFGIILFIHTTSVFISVISRSFFLTVTFLATAQVHFFFILIVTEKCIHLWITCSICDRIHSQMFAVGRALIRFQSKMTQHHQPIMNFLSHVGESGPKMSAMGYFRINRHLFPKLVGTFLTYFIILYQFQFSEKKTGNI